MANEALKNKWQPVLRWIPELRAAQAQVLAETGVWVPLIRGLSHIGLETGFTGDPKSKSKGPGDCCGNRCSSSCGVCCKPGKDCTSDCYFHGLFQLFWPPFGGVDWSKTYDPGYNCYLGMKTLAIRYKQCGNWTGASAAFFGGTCLDAGVIDPNTNVDTATYVRRIDANISELRMLGVGNATDDPKVPPTNGGENTPDGEPSDPKCVDVLGKKVCLDLGLDTISNPLDPVNIARAAFDAYLPRIAFIVLGVILLGIGVATVVFDTSPLGRFTRGSG